MVTNISVMRQNVLVMQELCLLVSVVATRNPMYSQLKKACRSPASIAANLVKQCI